MNTITDRQYTKVCAVVDRIKTDDRSLDTDEYAGMVLDALGLSTEVPDADPRRAQTSHALILCECCALKLANDDESGCRDFHDHAHAGLDVPAGAILAQGPYLWDGRNDLDCRGHEGGVGAISAGGTFYVAESFDEPVQAAGSVAGSVAEPT